MQALLKIVKHCHESLPHMVTGSLLGLVVENGVLEITHSFPFPDARSSSDNNRKDDDKESTGGDNDASGLEGHEFQLEMMRMLREVNVDNNCVGWYQSVYLGIYSTSSLLENQFSYQTDLSPSAVVILYDPMQTTKGNLMLRCYRLTEECIRMKQSSTNTFIDPANIFEQVPIKLTNPGLARAFLVSDAVTNSSSTATATAQTPEAATDTTFDRLDLNTNPYLEKHLEFLSGWVDDLAAEQHKFQYFTRQLARNASGGSSDPQGRRGRRDRGKEQEAIKAGWESTEAPRRMESLLISNQIRSYCDQMDQFAGGGMGKLFLAGGLHQEEESTAAASNQ